MKFSDDCVMGRRQYFNSLRAIAIPAGGLDREFHLVYMPDLQPEPVLVGDDSAAVRAWLSAVDAPIKTRPGLSLSCDRAQLVVDLARKRDSLEDFQLMTMILSRLVETLDMVRPTPIETRPPPDPTRAIAQPGSI